LVCEPVLAETMYLLGHRAGAREALFQLLQNGALSIALRLSEHVDALRELVRRQGDTPMSLADVCVMRMAEIHPRHAILTLNSDFLIYRRHGRSPLNLIRP
jgi:predicted nucleic acid-binding protein